MNNMLRLLLCTQFGMGLELPVSVAFVFISPLLLQAGFTGLHSSLILCCGSVIGLFFAPLFGFISDFIHTPIGRRRPFIIILGSCACFSLFMLPEVRRMKFFLSSLVVLLDSTSQICLSSYEALLADLFLSPFGMYSVMLNLGSMLGYLFAYIDWSALSKSYKLNTCLNQTCNNTSKLQIDLFNLSSSNDDVNVRVIFTIIGFIFALSFIIALIFGNEKRHLNKTEMHDTMKIPKCIVSSWCHIDKLPTWQSIKYLFCPVMNKLIVADGLTWASILCFKYYFSDYVGQFIFHGHPYPSSTVFDEYDRESLLARYNAGVRYASLLLFFQSLVACLFSLILQTIVNKFGCKRIYMFGILSFGSSIGFIVVFRIENFIIISILMALSGIGCACATALPFILLTKYHENKPYFFKNANHFVNRGIGADIGLLDASYFACQVALFALIGFVYKISLQATLTVSSLLAVCASFAIGQIKDKSPKKMSPSASIVANDQNSIYPLL